MEYKCQHNNLDNDSLPASKTNIGWTKEGFPGERTHFKCKKTRRKWSLRSVNGGYAPSRRYRKKPRLSAWAMFWVLHYGVLFNFVACVNSAPREFFNRMVLMLVSSLSPCKTPDKMSLYSKFILAQFQRFQPTIGPIPVMPVVKQQSWQQYTSEHTALTAWMRSKWKEVAAKISTTSQ